MAPFLNDIESETKPFKKKNTSSDSVGVQPVRNSVGESMKLKDALNFLKALKENKVQDVTKLYKSSRFVFGRDRSPALVIAAAICNREVVKKLIEKGEDVNCYDGKYRTPALVAAASGNEEVLEELLNSGAVIDYVYVCPEESPSKEENKEQWIKEDEIIGLNLPVPQRSQRTLLHEAVLGKHPRCVEILLNKQGETDLICKQDDQENTALHLAVNELPQREMDKIVEIVELLLGIGAPLCIRNNKSQSALNALLKNKELKPIRLLQRVFDKQIKFRDDDDRKFRLNFQPICSNVEKPHQVLNEFLETKCLDEEEQKELFKHPLLRAFVRRKWLSLYKLFYLSFAMYVLHVISLTTFVTFAHCDVFYIFLVGFDAGTALQCLIISAVILCITTLMVTIYVGCLTYVLQSCYRWKLEMWINSISCLLTFVVLWSTMYDVNNLFQWSDDGSHTEKFSTESNESNRNVLNYTLNLNNSAIPVVSGTTFALGTPEWVTQVTTFAIFFSWLEVMFLVGRFPRWASQALLLESVLKNVLQAMATYGCMIAGFSMVFFLQFGQNNPKRFGDPWTSFTKTIIMMTGEFEYNEVFKNEEEGGRSSFSLHLFSRVWFISFVVIASIALMNLMVGLAVSDTRELSKKCFESQMMKLAHSSIFLGYVVDSLPDPLHKCLKFLRLIPGRKEGNKIVYDLVDTVFPDELEYSLRQIAKRNSLQTLNRQNSELNDMLFPETGEDGIPINAAKRLNLLSRKVFEIHEMFRDSLTRDDD